MCKESVVWLTRFSVYTCCASGRWSHIVEGRFLQGVRKRHLRWYFASVRLHGPNCIACAARFSQASTSFEAAKSGRPLHCPRDRAVLNVAVATRPAIGSVSCLVQHVFRTAECPSDEPPLPVAPTRPATFSLWAPRLVSMLAFNLSIRLAA